MATPVAELERKVSDLIKRQEESVQAAQKAVEEIRRKWGDEAATAYKTALDAELKKRDERIDQLETRLNRPGTGAPSGGDQKDADLMKHFNAYLRKGVIAPELRALATDDQANGGFMVPHPLRKQILEKILEISPIRQNAQVDTITQGDALEVPVEEGEYGVGWVGQRGARAATAEGTFGVKRYQLREQYAFPKVTQQMLDDAGFNVEQWVARKIAQRYAEEENKAFLTGQNALQPEGMLKNPGTGATNTGIAEIETGTSVTLKPDDVLDLIAELKTFYTQGAKIYAHRKIINHLRKAKDTNGQYLWQPSLQVGLPATWAGYPVVEVPNMDDTVAAGKQVVVFGNMREGYQVVDKATVGMLRDPFTDKPNVGFYTTRRVGGGVLRGEALKILKVKA